MCAELYQCWLTDRRHMPQPDEIVEYPRPDAKAVAAAVRTLRRHSITGRIPPPIPRTEKDERLLGR